MSVHHTSIPAHIARRDFLRRTGCGFGAVALAALTSQQASAVTVSNNPLLPRAPRLAARAKRIIFLHMVGGPSQFETFDYKPRLNADDGKPAPFERVAGVEQPGVNNMRLFGSQWKFQQRGQSGLWISDLFPHIAGLADDLCVLKGMHTDNLAHAPACLQLHTGTTNQVRPSLGSWVLYGLGTENQNLPGFITVAPPLSGDQGSAKHFSNAFLPAYTQGTMVDLAPAVGSPPRIRNLQNDAVSATLQRTQLDLIQQINREQLASLKTDQQMEGVIQSYELAFRMQTEAPEVFDLSKETDATRQLYGIGDAATDHFGRQCLLARRLAEAGVRFIELSANGWDHHGGIRKNLPKNCAGVDKPIAGLIRDLKARGLFEDTLIVWSGEFGRTPYEQDLTNGKAAKESYGRGHNPFGFTTWMAGGGVKGGISHGNTDDYGYRAVEGKVHLHDLHATMLHLLGLDHEKLTYRYAGRDFRLTDVYGEVVKEILA